MVPDFVALFDQKDDTKEFYIVAISSAQASRSDFKIILKRSKKKAKDSIKASEMNKKLAFFSLID